MPLSQGHPSALFSLMVAKHTGMAYRIKEGELWEHIVLIN